MMRSLMRRKDRGITYSGFTSGLSRSYCALRMANAGITSPEARRCMTQTVRMLPAYIDDMLPKLLQRDNPQPSFHLDYLTGAGSSIMLYLRLYDVFHDMRIVEQTSRLGRTVIRAFPETQRNADESDDMPYPTGAAHGLEGMAVAFWKLYAATGIANSPNSPECFGGNRTLEEAVRNRRTPANGAVGRSACSGHAMSWRPLPARTANVSSRMKTDGRSQTRQISRRCLGTRIGTTTACAMDDAA